MKTYIIAIKDQETLEPYYFEKYFWDDIAQLLKNFWRAYIFNTKKKAEEVRNTCYKTYEERQK